MLVLRGNVANTLSFSNECFLQLVLLGPALDAPWVATPAAWLRFCTGETPSPVLQPFPCLLPPGIILLLANVDALDMSVPHQVPILKP